MASAYVPRRVLALSPARALLRPTTTTPTAGRPFGLSAVLAKKRKLAAPGPRGGRDDNGTAETTTTTAPGPERPDPLDLRPLEAAYAELEGRFKSQLQKLLRGGRFEPETLGQLRVPLKAAAGGATEPTSFRLRELAQVVPRSGRSLSLLVNDRAYIKPIMSAVQASGQFNQQPQRADDNPLELLLRVEPERRPELARRLKETTAEWRQRVREARARLDRALKEARKSGLVLPDAARRADRELQKLQDKKMREIDADEAHALKQLERHAA